MPVLLCAGLGLAVHEHWDWSVRYPVLRFSFDVETMSIEALMFQTGYLTIKEREHLGGNYFYRLGYPNREVYQSLNNSLLTYLVQDGGAQVRQRLQQPIHLLGVEFSKVGRNIVGFEVEPG